MRCLKFQHRKNPVDIQTNPKGVKHFFIPHPCHVIQSKHPARYHEAGYDALITGRCFLSLCQRLGRLAGSGGSGRVLPNSPLLQPYLNKARLDEINLLNEKCESFQLHLMRIQDIPYMDLGGADLKPSRDHVFHLKFPKEWKTHDLKQLFQERFGDVQVAWIDDTQACVALRDKEQAGQVNEDLRC